MHSFCKKPVLFITLVWLSHCFLSTNYPIAAAAVNRRLLHQPLFPVDRALPPEAYPEPPFSSPEPQPPGEPKYPFSSLAPPTSQQTQTPFFPFFTSPPPPPPPPTAAMVTFPANISSLILPRSSSSSKPISRKLVAVIISASVLSAAVLLSIVGFLYLHHNRRRYHRHEPPTAKTDNVRLFPPNVTPSDRTPTTKKVPRRPPPPPPPQLSRHTASTSSSEFLYLGTLVSSREVVNDIPHSPKNNPAPYQSLGSPELLPLPPLPRHQFQDELREPQLASDDEDEYFSPRDSTGERQNIPEEKNEAENGRISNSNSYQYSQNHSLMSSPSIVLNLSPKSSMRSVSPDSIANFPAPPMYIPIPAREQTGFRSSPPSSGDTRNSPSRVSDSSGMYMESPGEILSLSARFGAGVGMVAPPPPTAPPPPPPRFWETPVMGAGPPELVAPSRPVLGQNGENVESVMQPRLKALHWDKVRASSDRATVWDQLKSSSFQLNEEMIQSLFTANALNLNPNAKDGVWRPTMATGNQENQVLDLKKSQNIAILLRALNVTEEEVCDALLEGNADMLGTELLESLLKMAPTKEEETKLREFKDESPFKLGPAEKFLKAVLCVPNAFKRVDAMLYIANFDSEVQYLNRSFETLEESCKELRNSRMFMKLIEAVLKTGNRMNVGTNRGDAHAFKLDTLLKLVDVKGTDGKTTLLHFVVQEIIKAEGARVSGATPNQTAETDPQLALQNEVEFKKTGLQVVSGLIGELSNVKKAASMDSVALNHDLAKLASGIDKIDEVLKLSKEELVNKGFSEYLEGFLKKAEEDIVALQAQEGVALSMVKELTEYFHGNSSKEEAHPFRTFMVVRDFLSILDQVCKDVGKMNERTMMSSGRQFQTVMNHPNIPHVFPELHGLYNGSDDDDRLSFSP